MKVLFDTSVLVAGLIKPHPHHDRALPWLERARSGDLQLLIASHSLAELYSVLSTYPIKPRIGPAIAWRLIQENIGVEESLVPLTSMDYMTTVQRVSELGLSGGVIFDALIACAAEKAGAERLLTFNAKDYRRVWPQGESILLVP